jgi:type IV pilus assembly protein PilC
MAGSVAVNQVAFLWEGKDNRGKKVRGKSVAADENALRAELRRQGVIPVKIKKQQGLFKSSGSVTPADIAIFSRQLATMLASGIPLVQAFEIVGAGHDNPAMQNLILSIKADLESGSSLAECLGKHPLHFDDLFVNRLVPWIPCWTRSPPTRKKPRPSRKRSRRPCSIPRRCWWWR